MDYLAELQLDAGEQYPLAHRVNGVALADLLGPGVWLPGRQDFYALLSDVEQQGGLDVSSLRRLDDSALRTADSSQETHEREGYVLGPRTWQSPLELALCLQSILGCLESHPDFLPYDFSGTVFERTTELLRALIGECLWAAERQDRVRFALAASSRVV